MTTDYPSIIQINKDNTFNCNKYINEKTSQKLTDVSC